MSLRATPQYVTQADLDALREELERRLAALEAPQETPVAVPRSKGAKRYESEPGICAVTGEPSGTTCEHFSTYKYQQGCQGACLEQGRQWYRLRYTEQHRDQG